MASRTYFGAVCGIPGNYGIVFPDFPGCTSQGDTLDQVQAMGREALAGHLAVMVDYGDVVPEPTEVTLESVSAEYDEPGDPDDEQWVAVVPITIEMPAIADRVRVDLPRELADEVRAFDPHPGHFIVEATRRELARLKQSA